MARYHGKNGRVYCASTGSGAAVDIGNVSDWSIDMPRDEVDTTSMGDANATAVYGHRRPKITLSGFWDDATDVLFDASELDEAVAMYIYPSAAAPTKYWYGFVMVDASVNAAVNAAVKISANCVPVGTWARY